MRFIDGFKVFFVRCFCAFFEVISMVCNSTQSALYRAVDVHNDTVSECGIGQKKSCEKNTQKIFQKREKNNSRNTDFDGIKNCCENCPKKHINSTPSDPISRIMSDRDMLLIAGLIFILAREDADKKLIMALAIVLLG